MTTEAKVKTEQERIEAQARRAFASGKSIVDCPYRKGARRFLWRQAFRAVAGAEG